MREHFPDVEVWAYGSRVNGRGHEGSDLDLVLRGPGLQEIPLDQLVDFENAIRESNIPFLVEARDWMRLPERFRREIEGVHVVVIGSGEADSDWNCGPLGDLVTVHLEKVNPSAANSRLFAHYSIPAFEDGQMPVVEPGAEIKSTKFTVPSDAVLVSRLNPRFPRVWAPNVTDDIPAICSTEFSVLRPCKVDRHFLHQLCMAPSFRASLLKRVTGTSSSHQRVPPASLLDIEVSVPPLPEQRAIAQILGTLDDKIEVNRRMNETLEAMARALFKSWFVDFDPVRAKMEGRDTGLPKHIADLFPSRLVDSEMGKIPVGWEVWPLDAIAHFQNGLALQKHRPAKGQARLPVVKIAQLRTGRANGKEWARADIKPECILNNGDVVFSWSGSLLVHIWCGGTAALNQHLFKVTSSKLPKWFYLHCVLVHLSNFQRIAQDKTTTMGHIKRKHLNDALCVVAPDSAIISMSHIFNMLLKQQITNELESRTLITLRDTLLPKLILGEIRLPNAATGMEA